MKKLLFKLESHGFEDLYDFEERLIAAINNCTELDTEFSGILIASIEYDDELDE